MRRRRFVASVAALTALAGCLGEGREEVDEASEPSGDTDWEPITADASGGEPGSEEAGSSDEDERSGIENGTDEATADGNRGANGADGALEEGTAWEAERAQVAVDARGAGAAVEFELETAPIESCGRTCRELRAALTNAGTGDAHDVVVDTELTSGGEVLRERREVIGDLPAGETYRATERVDLSAIEAIRVQQNGALTVEHVVTSGERREVFRERIEP